MDHAKVPEAFLAIVQRAHRGRSKQEAAEQIGIKPQRFSKLLRGRDYSLKAENCLRLAKLTHLPPADVLRAAGKGAFADLLDELYGPKTTILSGPFGAKVTELWDALDEPHQHAVLNFVLASLGLPLEPPRIPTRETVPAVQPSRVRRSGRQ